MEADVQHGNGRGRRRRAGRGCGRGAGQGNYECGIDQCWKYDGRLGRDDDDGRPDGREDDLGQFAAGISRGISGRYAVVSERVEWHAKREASNNHEKYFSCLSNRKKTLIESQSHSITPGAALQRLKKRPNEELVL